MKPVAGGEKTEHVTKVGEEIDREKEETPISIISTDSDAPAVTVVPVISEQVN